MTCKPRSFRRVSDTSSHSGPRRGASWRHVKQTVALAVVCVGLTSGLTGVASASEFNISGTWKTVYHCEHGWCAGQDFPGGGVVVQARGSNDVYTGDGVFIGTLKGRELVVHSGSPGEYQYDVVEIYSEDASSWSGLGSDSNGTSGIETGERISGPPRQAAVAGAIRDFHEKGLPGVKVKLSGTSDKEEPISEEATSDSAGKYSFEVPPGTYSVIASGEPADHNGGSLAVAGEIGSAAGGEINVVTPAPQCSGQAQNATCALNPLETGQEATANFLYTACTSKDRAPNGKPPTGCPIVFIPGFLGSRLTCSSGEVWTSVPWPDFKDMQLLPDGITNSGAPGSCAQTTEPLSQQAGVVATAAGADIYASALAYLNRIAPDRAYAYPYDWRKSPLRAVPELDHQINDILKQTAASRVVVMAHSMGGLVTQAYVSHPELAEKVIRAITVGTPYWGAPKSHTALMSGKSDELTTELFGLDFLIDANLGGFKRLEGPDINKAENNLQLAARNMQGLYWLYPSNNYGPWLSVKGEAFSPSARVGSGLDPWVAVLGGEPSLVDSAAAGHAALDGFKTNGVQYRAMIGIGTPTVTGMDVNHDPVQGYAGVFVAYGSGDGTVPARSASQGVFEGNAPIGEDVPISTQCNVSHVALPGNAAVQARIEDFLLKGEEVKKADNKSEEDCPYAGKEWTLVPVKLPEPGAKASKVVNSTSIATSTGTSMTLEAAAAHGLIQLVQQRSGTTVVTDNHNPVTIKLVGKGLSVRVRSLTSAHKGNFGGSGAPTYYGPANGTLTLSEKAVLRNGKKLKSIRAPRAPRASARVTRSGKRFVVRLSAKSSVGISGIYTRIGKGASHRYTKPLKLTKAQLHKLRFVSVDRFGNWGRSQKAPAPH